MEQYIPYSLIYDLFSKKLETYLYPNLISINHDQDRFLSVYSERYFIVDNFCYHVQINEDSKD